MKKILVIAAHPDDEVLGVGGTISKYRELGYEIYTHIVTDGSSTQYAGDKNKLKQKKEEAIKANEILGVKKVYFGNLPDMKLDTVPHVAINKEIERTIKVVKPNIVFTHHAGDVNKDHKLIFESTLVACRPNKDVVQEIYSYEVPSSTEWSDSSQNDFYIPNVFISLNKKNIDRKITAMKKYETEIREYPHPSSIKSLINYSRYRGNQIGKDYAEAFRLIRRIIK